MRVFLTGATGFIGSHLVPELVGAGHEVVGLSRSDEGVERLARLGAEVVRGDVNDLALLTASARASDGVIHAAFNHDPAQSAAAAEDDRRAIMALGAALADSDRPLVVTSGTGLVAPTYRDLSRETDPPAASSAVPRAATEEAATALADQGVRVMVMRLPQVHDAHRQGRIAWHIDMARKQGRVAYVGDGANRLPAVHVSDAVRLYRLALERGGAGARYHAVAQEGVPLRDIAEAIGAGLNMPVVSLTPDEAKTYFGWMANLAAQDLAASGALTREWLDWTPTGPDLLADLRAKVY